MKITKIGISHFVALSSWIYYIGFWLYHYFLTNTSYTFMKLLTGVFAPFVFPTTACVALMAMTMTMIVCLTKRQDKFWLIAILQWLYVGSAFLAIHALNSV